MNTYPKSLTKLLSIAHSLLSETPLPRGSDKHRDQSGGRYREGYTDTSQGNSLLPTKGRGTTTRTVTLNGPGHPVHYTFVSELSVNPLVRATESVETLTVFV